MVFPASKRIKLHENNRDDTAVVERDIKKVVDGEENKMTQGDKRKLVDNDQVADFIDNESKSVLVPLKKLKPDSSIEFKLDRISLSSNESDDLAQSDATALPNLTNRLHKLKKKRFFRRFENAFHRASIVDYEVLSPYTYLDTGKNNGITKVLDVENFDDQNKKIISNDVFMGYCPDASY